MNIGEKLYKLRKDKNLSQEEVADILGVSRQTISKWETNGSLPDLDKVAPLCKLYEISADQLLTGKRENKNVSYNDNKKLRAKGIGLGVLGYFLAIISIMITIPVLDMNPIIATSIFLLICGFATYIIIYTAIVYKKEEETKKEEIKGPRKIIHDLLLIIMTLIYLLVSFKTMAWHITWIIWIVYVIFDNIINLIYELKGGKDE